MPIMEKFTRSDLLNAFISQISMSWTEEEMQEGAGVRDVLFMMTTLNILFRACASRLVQDSLDPDLLGEEADGGGDTYSRSRTAVGEGEASDELPDQRSSGRGGLEAEGKEASGSGAGNGGHEDGPAIERRNRRRRSS